jgi:hypothetical protein
MNKSESIKELASALAKAQGELKNPGFDSTNPHFKSKYASLAAVRDAVIPILSRHGLSVVQAPMYEAGMAGCETLLSHSSGEFVSGVLMLPVDKQNAHGVGSSQTYARRYALMAFAGVVGDEDDDGNAAVEKKVEKKAPDAEGAAALLTCASLKDLQTAWEGLNPAQRVSLGPTKDAVKARLLEAANA